MPIPTEPMAWNLHLNSLQDWKRNDAGEPGARKRLCTKRGLIATWPTPAAYVDGALMEGSLPPLIAPRYLIASLLAHGVIAATPLARPPASLSTEPPPPLRVTMRQAIVAVPPSALPEPRQTTSRSAHLPAVDRPRVPPPLEALATPTVIPVMEPPAAPDAVADDPQPSIDQSPRPLPSLARLAPEAEVLSPRSGPSDTHLLSLYTQELVARLHRGRTYPKLARIRGWQGTTVVDVRIGSEGEVLSLDVASSSGHELLDDQALRMIREASPLPAPNRAEGTPLLVQVPITFSLR